MGFAVVGYLVLGVILLLGVYWLTTNVQIKPQYTYRKDEEGNEIVTNNKEDKE